MIIVIGVVGVVYLGALVGLFMYYQGDMAVATTILSGAVGIVITQLLTLRQSAANMTKITNVATVIDENTEKTARIEQVATQTHLAVNSRMDDLIAKVEQLASVQAELIAARKLAEGIAIGRAQMDAPDHIAERNTDAPEH